MSVTDPMEILIEEALLEAREPFVTQGPLTLNLDFFLPRKRIYIEVKRFHSDRISDQMGRVPNVIVAQGAPAVQMLADLLRNMNK